MQNICALICSRFNLSKSIYDRWVQNWDGSEKSLIGMMDQENLFSSDFPKKMFSIKDIEGQVIQFNKQGIVIVDHNHKAYPFLLKEIHRPPILFFALGNLELLFKEKLSIVGSREIFPWVGHWMKTELVQFHRSRPEIVTVSGGARGVDFFAHKAAIQEGVGTIVVLPSGLLAPYPRDIHSRLQGDKTNILWISEYWPQQVMRKFHFHKRNRIIAGLSSELFVAQAGVKSGSMITARLAIENNRATHCLPMTPFHNKGAGNLKLLFEGAGMIRFSEDLCTLFQQKRHFEKTGVEFNSNS